jgi:hypothetical protein
MNVTFCIALLKRKEQEIDDGVVLKKSFELPMPPRKGDIVDLRCGDALKSKPVEQVTWHLHEAVPSAEVTFGSEEVYVIKGRKLASFLENGWLVTEEYAPGPFWHMKFGSEQQREPNVIPEDEPLHAKLLLRMETAREFADTGNAQNKLLYDTIVRDSIATISQLMVTARLNRKP